MKKQGHIPPKWTVRFLKWFCKTEYLEDIQGDLYEEYSLVAGRKTRFEAKVWFNWQVLLLFRPAMIKKIKTQNSIEKELSMLQNYLKIAWRNITKYKSSTILNILGLSTGIAAFILIALFIKDEMSYDRHFSQADNIYRVTVKNFDSDGNKSRHWAFASAGHAERLKEDYAAIENAVRFNLWAFPDLQHGDKKFPSQQVVFSDDKVFEVFDFNFIKGDPATAMEDIYSLVLTESSAIRIFGSDWADQNILDETIVLSRDGQNAPFKVSGVIEDMPEHQHFHFEYLAPLRFYSLIMGENTMKNVGGNYNFVTYIKVAENANVNQLQAEANAEFWDKYIGKLSNGRMASEYYEFQFQPLLDIHLHSDLEGEIESNGSIEQVIIFGIVGALLLLVACINYMNLATSQYSRRTKEVGVRKVVGAFRSSLIYQFLTESFLITMLSLPFAIGLVYWMLPYMNNFLSKTLSLNFIEDFSLLAGIFILMALVALLAGSYPALYLSRLKLVQALKGGSKINAGKWNFRSWLVAFQYAVTIGLIFSLLVIESQLSFIRDTDPGYEKEQLLQISLSRNIGNLETFKQELLRNPNITSASFASRIPTGRLADSWGAGMYKGDSLTPASFRLPFIATDEDFLQTFEIPLIAGQNFKATQDMSQDSTGYYIINRAAAEAFGYENPQDIIGKRLAYGPYNGQQYKMGRIYGVSENFHFESMHTEIKPMVMLKNTGYMRQIVLKIDRNQMESTLTNVEKIWADFDATNSISYRFVDDRFNEQYLQEERLSSMITVFTIIAILIGCLGLIGMVAFIIETKVKEIGIRKVLGASMQNIMQLVTARFIVLIIVSYVIIIPVAYLLMSGWLEGFVYRTVIGPEIFLLPVAVALVITILSTGYQTVRASLINPVDCLKDE